MAGGGKERAQHPVKSMQSAALVFLVLLTSCGAPPRPRILGVIHSPQMPEDLSGHVAELLGDRLGAVRLREVSVSPLLAESVEEVRLFIATERPSVVVVFGTSRYALTLAPVLADAGIPHVLPTATSNALVGITPWTLVLTPSDQVEGEVLARFAVRSLGMRRPAIIYQSEDYGASIKDGLVQELAKQGVTDVFLIPLHPLSDMSLVSRGAATVHQPDGVIVAAYGNLARALAPFLDRDLPDVPRLGTSAALSMAGPGIGEEERRATRGFYGASPWLPELTDPHQASFQERFRRVVGAEPDGHAALFYDALEVAIVAIEANPRPRAVRRYLTDLGLGRPPVPGLTGPIHFQGDRADLLGIGRVEATGLRRVRWRSEQ